MTNELATRAAGLDMADTLPDVERLASTLMRAGNGFIPKHFTNAAQVAAVILSGREMGVPPMASLRNFFLIEGKVGMDASFVLGRMLSAGVTHEWLRDDDTGAVVRLTRPGGKPYESSFTKEDAIRAGLWSKNIWKQYPRAMLRARAITAGARAYAPDVFAGAVYTAEELRGGDEEHAPQAAPQRIESVAAAVVASSGADVPEASEPGTVSRLLEAIDVAGSEVELQQIKELGVNPVWDSMTLEERGDIRGYFKRARMRIAAINRAAVEAMERDAGGGAAGSGGDAGTNDEEVAR